MLLKEITEEIQDVQNQEIISKYRAFQSSIELLDRNFHTLKKLLNTIENNPSKFDLIPRYNKWLREGIIKEIVFLLHNYVASSMSLIDHSRRIYEKSFENKNRLDEYEQLKKDYLKSPYLKFVQDLRRMLQHHSLASIGFQYVGGTGDMNFYLQKVDLLRFEEWTSKSKQFIESFEEKIDIKQVINEYQKEITNFHRQVDLRFKSIYKSELQELEELYDIYNEKVNELALQELREQVENFEDQGFHGIKFSFSKWLDNSEQAELIKKANNDKHYCKLAYPIVKKEVSIPEDLDKLIKKHFKER